MANDSIQLYNFYYRYKWNKDDFAGWQEGMVDHSRGMFEGLFSGAIMEGFAPSGVAATGGSDLAVTVSAGISSGPTGYLGVINDPTQLEFDAPTGDFERALVVVKPDLVDNTTVSIAQAGIVSQPLRTAQKAAVEILRGTLSTTPEYPTKGDNDVIVCGLRLYSGQTSIADEDIDLSVREVPGSNSNFQQNFGRYDDRLRPYRDDYKTVKIKPSQLENPFPRNFTYLSDQTPAIFPKDGSGNYNGSSGDTSLDFESGAITGADAASSNFSPTIPSSGSFIVACVGLNISSELEVNYGTEGTRAQCFDGIKNQSVSGAGSVSIPGSTKPICYVIVESQDGSTVAGIDVIDARDFAAVGSDPKQKMELIESNQTWTCPQGVERVKLSIVDELYLDNRLKMGEVDLWYIDEHGTLWGSGANASYELADGTSSDKSVFTRASELPVPMKMISAVRDEVMGMDIYGRLWAWGTNVDGGLGTEDTTLRSTPTLVQGDTNWKFFSKGMDHTLAIDNSGNMWAWGENIVGQLGTNVAGGDVTTPAQVVGGHTWKFCMAGDKTSAGITEDGDLYMWGEGTDGALGQGDTLTYSSPVIVPGGLSWKMVALDDTQCTLAITTDGDMYAWGDNSSYEMGDGTTVDKSTPTQIGAGNTWLWCDRGNEHSVAITTDGVPYAWGTDTGGNLGVGVSGVGVSTPTQLLGSISNAKLIEAGDLGNALATEHGEIYTWGDETSGRLANGGTAGTVTSPTLVSSRRIGLKQQNVITSYIVDVVAGTDYAIDLESVPVTFGETEVAYVGGQIKMLIEYGVD
jgi:alpha-tubulin suppressor-like RCC1 family protein